MSVPGGLPVPPRAVRVFISSTFADMQEERDELVKHVFPKLRELCDSRAVTWGEVDLRWGITAQEARDGLVLPRCLEEIDECRPYFLGLLGEWYGSILKSIDPDLMQRQPWLAEHRETSLTELEIIHGVLNNPDMAGHAFFYFRQPRYRGEPHPDDIRTVGYQKASERLKKLASLKQRIRDSGLPVRENYANPRQLAQLVLADLTTMIDRRFPVGSQPTPLERERRLHAQFVMDRAAVYIERPRLFAVLDAHANGEGPPMAVLGVAGVGKSALLANWAARRMATERMPRSGDDRDTFTLMHFVAASPDGANWEKVARRIIAEFEDRFGWQSNDLADLAGVRERLAEIFQSVPTNQRAILVIDGLNQLEDRDGALDLVWLPASLPPNVRLVVSTLPGRPLDEWLRRGWSTVEVQSLSQSEKALLINDYLKQYAKRLPGDLVEDIAAAPQTGNPLFLRLMLEELRVYGDHDTLRRRLEELLDADDVPSLYTLILSRWEHDYDRDRPALVAESMVLLWASRRGLSESELRDLLGSDVGPLHHDVWSALYRAARQTLVNHDGTISFAHDYARSAVENRYLKQQLARGAVHMRLAEYFLATYNRNLPAGFEELRVSGKVSEAARTLQTHRLFEELPWQVAQAGEWEKLAELFGGAVFFGFAWIRDRFEVCRYWRDIERHNPGAALRTFAPVIASPGHDFDLSWHVALLLGHLGHQQECAEIFRRLDADPGAAMSASDKAGIAVNAASAELNAAAEQHVARTLDELDAAVAQAHSSGADRYAAAGLRNKAAALFKDGQHREALPPLAEAEATYRHLGDWEDVASCLAIKAPILDLLGDTGSASAAFDEQERIYRESGNLGELAAALCNHANSLLGHDDSTAAEALLNDAVGLGNRLGDDRRLAHVHEVRARARWERDWSGCLADIADCERLARDSGARATEANAIYLRAMVALALQEWSLAELLAGQAAEIRRELNDDSGIAQCTELAKQAVARRTAASERDTTRSKQWEFPVITDFWEHRTEAVRSGAKRLAELPPDDRGESLAELGEQVLAHVAGLDQGRLLATAWIMAEDLYKSVFNGLTWNRDVADYLKGSAGVLISEMRQRGLALDYVIDNAISAADFVHLLRTAPAIFRDAGLTVAAPPSWALSLMEEDGRQPDIAAIPAYMAKASDIADSIVSRCQDEHRSFVFLNLAVSDGPKSKISFAIALSEAHEPNTIVVFRQQPPLAGTTSEVFLPPGMRLT